MIYVMGGDGAGKSTFAASLAAEVQTIPWEPSSKVWGRHVKAWEDRDFDLWWADRAEYREEWVEACKQLCAVEPLRSVQLFSDAGHTVYDGLRSLRSLTTLLSCESYTATLYPSLVVWVGDPEGSGPEFSWVMLAALCEAYSVPCYLIDWGVCTGGD